MSVYKVICKDTDPEWLDHRHKYLTASNAATLFGVNKWGGSYSDLVEEKAAPETPPPLQDTANMWHGREDEANNMRKFSKALGLRCKQTHVFLASTKCRLAATLDGMIINKSPETIPYISKDSDTWLPALKDRIELSPGVGILEMKQTEAWFRKDWDSSIPEYYLTQVQTQLYVSGVRWAVVACQIGAAMFKAYYVLPDLEFHRELESKVNEFWKDVERYKK